MLPKTVSSRLSPFRELNKCLQLLSKENGSALEMVGILSSLEVACLDSRAVGYVSKDNYWYISDRIKEMASLLLSIKVLY
jgi:hypothetical protein